MVAKRILIEHKEFVEDGVKIYLYVYEVDMGNGKKKIQRVKIKNSYTKLRQYDEERDSEQVEQIITAYLKENAINLDNYRGRTSYLNNFTSQIKKKIVEELKIKLNQPEIKEFIINKFM